MATTTKKTIHEHEFGKDDCTYEELDDGKVKCLTCAHECVIAPGGSGFCAVRQNVDGRLKLIVYANANCANARDPIEKKRKTKLTVKYTHIHKQTTKKSHFFFHSIQFIQP